MVYTIYGLYDSKDNLRYIGMTQFSLLKRYREHINYARTSKASNHKLCWLRGMLKRGEKPLIKVIDIKNTLEELREAEIYWINFYKAQGAKLVNSCEGGLGINGYKWDEALYLKKSKPVDQYSLKGVLITTHKSLSDAAESVGSRRSNGKISGCCKGLRGRRTAFGFIWRYKGEDFNKHPTTSQINITQAQKDALSLRQSTNNCMKNRTGILNPRSRPVEQYSKDGIKLLTYDSLTSAKLLTGATNLHKALTKGVLSNGFYWRYANKDIVQSSEKSESNQLIPEITIN